MRNAEFFSPAFRSIRIRTLFANRGSGLEPAITVINLLNKEYDPSERILLNGKLLKVLERIDAFSSIQDLIDSITKGQLILNDQYVGFTEEEDPYWDYSVIPRRDIYNGHFAKTNTIQLSGHFNVKDSPKGYESQFQQEMKLSPQLQATSLKQLTEKLLGASFGDISYKRVEIFAPSFVMLSNLEYYGKEVNFKVFCSEESEKQIQFFALFHHDDGSISTFKPRMKGYTKNTADDSMIEIIKSFETPIKSRTAISVELTISMDGKIGVDSGSVMNLPVANPTWSIIRSLDVTKISKYLKLSDFESRLSLIKDADLFESIVISLIASCGYIPLWTGGFKMSGKDLLVLDNKRTLVLIECTTGSPRDKIGLMKTAIEELKDKLSWLELRSIVVTSQSVSDAERKDAATDNVQIRDAGDLKVLLFDASPGVSDKEIRHWLALDI